MRLICRMNKIRYSLFRPPLQFSPIFKLHSGCKLQVIEITFENWVHFVKKILYLPCNQLSRGALIEFESIVSYGDLFKFLRSVRLNTQNEKNNWFSKGLHLFWRRVVSLLTQFVKPARHLFVLFYISSSL